MSVEELKAEAPRLDTEERAYLARALLASLDGLSDGEIEKLRIDEAIRRDEELDRGLARSPLITEGDCLPLHNPAYNERLKNERLK